MYICVKLGLNRISFLMDMFFFYVPHVKKCEVCVTFLTSTFDLEGRI